MRGWLSRLSSLMSKPEIDPVQEIKNSIRHDMPVSEAHEAIEKLKNIGTEQASDTMSWLFIQSTDKNAFIFNDSLVSAAIEASVSMEQGAMNIYYIIQVEAISRGFEKSKDIPGSTHEDLAIKSLLEIGGEEGFAILSIMIAQHYPVKVIRALQKTDTPETVPNIAAAASVTPSYGLSYSNVQGLGALINLNQQVKSGVYKNISSDSIQESVEKLSRDILNVKTLLHCLRNGLWYETAAEAGKRSAHRITDDTSPLSSEKINTVRQAFKRVDNSGITPTKMTPLFNAIVDHHKATLETEQELSAQINNAFTHE